MIKILVTNTNIYSNFYLMFTKNLEKIVCFLVNIIKNKEKKDYSTFVIVTVILSLILSTTHSTVSPTLISIICAIGAGKVVLTDLDLVAPLVIFVFCLNITTITSYLGLLIHILVVLPINKLLFTKVNKKVNFIYKRILKY